MPSSAASAKDPIDVDVAIVGAGGAGLSLAVELDRITTSTGRRALSVALVDPVVRQGADRTWCFWDTRDSGLEPAVSRSWKRVGLVDRLGRSQILDLTPLRYVMIGSADFYVLAEQSLRRLDAVRVLAPALTVVDGSERAEVRTTAGTVRARWVFDSRPAPPRRPARTAWLQHFRGWTVRLDRPMLDLDEAVLMDFSVVQPGPALFGNVPDGGAPGPGLAFGYVLPTAADRALVEYTVFSRYPLPGPAYDVALRAYLSARLTGTDPGASAGPAGRADPVAMTVETVEDGVIPMTDAEHARRVGHRVFRLGVAGGATRGSSGYAFAAMRRQAHAVAETLVNGTWSGRGPLGRAPVAVPLPARVPVPPRAYPRRHRWMDAVLLRALDQELVDGPDLFVELFRHNPPARVLRFLDGMTSVREELAVMASTPTQAMARAAIADAVARLRDAVAGSSRRRG